MTLNVHLLTSFLHPRVGIQSKQFVIEGTSGEVVAIPGLQSLLPAPIRSIADLVLAMLNLRVQCESLLRMAYDGEVVVHARTEYQIRIHRIQFDSPNTSSKVDLLQRPIERPAVKQSQMLIVAAG